MTPAYSAYRLLGRLLYPFLYPALSAYWAASGGRRSHIRQRFGHYERALAQRLAGVPRIWIHAASVGEVGVAGSIIDSLRTCLPDAAIVLSVTTEHGRVHARETLDPAIVCIRAPIDLPPAVDRALDGIRPDMLVCIETEIWPNWLTAAQDRGIKTAIINGRISIRSIKSYLRIRSLLMAVLSRVDAFSMIGPADASRITRLGAPPGRVTVNGNAKYDRLLSRLDPSMKGNMASRLNVKDSDPIWVAGSTRRTEQEIVLNAYEKICRSIPEALLIIAPRHLSRIPEIEGIARKRGLAYQRWTDLREGGVQRRSPVVIVDTIGDLHGMYSIGSLIFCGGSLVPLGGQNIMEAAVWGKPVLYGPSMEDFLDAKALLERTGGGIQVADGQELYEKACYLLGNPSVAEKTGRRALAAVLSNEGAAEKHASVICSLVAAAS